jgi:uncharacterized membrane protein YfcA
MKIAVKYLILVFGFLAGFYSLSCNIGAGIASAGALLSFAFLEIQDLKIDNALEEE